MTDRSRVGRGSHGRLRPTVRQLTRPTQLDKKRFELEWILPLEPGLSTHVTLFDLECCRPHALATGEGEGFP